MSENDNHCAGCENNCCHDFKLFRSREEIAKLVEEYPFFRVVGTGVELHGNQEKVYRKLECDRLQKDGNCKDYPNNRPTFCEKTGVESRPAINCKLNDSIIKENE